jgi:hypothetical protein
MQDGYMCEWLKMRNLLTELDPSNQANYKGWCDDDENFVFDSSLTVRVWGNVCVCVSARGSVRACVCALLSAVVGTWCTNRKAPPIIKSSSLGP